MDRLYAFSEGNALFLNEAIAHAVESGSESLADADSALSGIANVIAARTALLGETARVVAEIAAICGHGCSVDVVRDVAGLSTAQTREAFNELLDRRLVREAGARDRFDFVFTHHLIGTSIYDQIDGDVRARRHARIAYVLEERPARRVGIVRIWLATTIWPACRSWRRAGTDMPRARRPQSMPTTMRSHWRRWPSTGRAIPPYSSKRYSCAKKPMPGWSSRGASPDLDRLDQFAETAELRCRILAGAFCF